MIPEKTAVRDLGITMSNDASFSIYINEKVAAMNSKISWVLRSFKTRDKLPMLTLWKQLVLTVSDHNYWSQLWSPDKVGDIQSLELLQRSYLRKIHGMQSLSYWDQLQQLGLYSLERRRERYIATYVWKILEGIAPNISDDHGISAQRHTRRGRECRVLKVSTSAPSRIQTIRFSSFAVKGIFNSLPMHLRNFTGGTVDNFKHRLEVYLQNIPDEPLIPGYTAFRTVNSNSIIAWSANLAHLAQHHLDDPAADISWQAERGDLTGLP